MKCPYCSTTNTRVLATRGTLRQRECFNLHRFCTEERAVRTRTSSRDKQMLAMWRKGHTMTAVAKAFGLKTHSEVSRALKRLGAAGTRTHGQLARWRSQGELPL